MDVTCFLTQHWNSRRQLRHPKPERLGAEIMDLPHSITFARVQGLQRRARASTTKSSDLRLADRALGHQVCHIQLTIELRKHSSSYFSFKCVVVNRSRTLEVSRICTHESLNTFAGALFVTFTICPGSNRSGTHPFSISSSSASSASFFFFGSKQKGQRDPND